MGQEQRKFIPPNHGNRDGSLHYAYDPEHQAGLVMTAQRNGRLRSARFVLETVEQKEEASERWNIVNSYMSLYARDCDEEVIRNLAPNENLIRIEGFDYKPDIDFGRWGSVIAAVLTRDGRVLYRSPEFDLEAYRQEQAQKEKGL